MFIAEVSPVAMAACAAPVAMLFIKDSTSPPIRASIASRSSLFFSLMVANSCCFILIKFLVRSYCDLSRLFSLCCCFSSSTPPSPSSPVPPPAASILTELILEISALVSCMLLPIWSGDAFATPVTPAASDSTLYASIAACSLIAGLTAAPPCLACISCISKIIPMPRC